MKDIPIRHIPENDQEPDLLGGFSIRSIEAMLEGKDMVQELHRHDFYLIIVLSKGKGFHEIDFIPYDVGDYFIFLLRPGQVHKLKLQLGSTGYFIQFKKEYYYSHSIFSSQLMLKIGKKNLCQLTSESFKKLENLISSVLLEFTEKQEDYHEVIKAQMGIFFIELLRHRQNTDPCIPSSTPYQQERLERFQFLIEENIVNFKQVSQYADMLHLTVYQLNSITKALLKKNASQLINEYIILEAKRNLLATSTKVSQIAYNMGYEDVSYFIRFFKKHTGYSPDTYRHNFR